MVGVEKSTCRVRRDRRRYIVQKRRMIDVEGGIYEAAKRGYRETEDEDWTDGPLYHLAPPLRPAVCEAAVHSASSSPSSLLSSSSVSSSLLRNFLVLL